ncbi:MAG: hypothetical protein L7H18_02965 [Candidatus Nealsonbacteria bacterium DGGOD1a]|jgi:hypothetical protein|nr:MAG: hypothetical protein L7H18_02965 [Candidatus Nealsonbacteria bacterium DGGOD1a]
MSNKKIIIALAVLAILSSTQNAAAISMNELPATRGNAATSTDMTKNRGANDNGRNALSKIQERGGEEIDRRVESLNKLEERVRSMIKINDSQKNAIIAQLQTQIESLNALKARIAAGTSASTTLENEKKITKEFRVYALTIPRGYIIAAIDRIDNMAQKLQGLSDKLAAKITETKPDNAAKLQESVADMNTRIANARTQVMAAQAKVENLKPDNGDEAIAKSNQEALIAAKGLVKTATNDLNYARNAANALAKELRKLGIKTNVGFGAATTTASTTTEL